MVQPWIPKPAASLLANHPLQSLRIVPAKAHPSHTSGGPGAPSAPGVHDTLRTNLNLGASTPSKDGAAPDAAPLQSTHPLEARLAQWRATQDALKMEGLRRAFGIAEPVKRAMELQICRAGEWRPALLGPGAALSSDVLAGRDAEIGWQDVFKGMCALTGEELGLGARFVLTLLQATRCARCLIFTPRCSGS